MECIFSAYSSELDHVDIYCGRAFFALLYVKGNLVAFSERLEAAPINARMMNKYVRTVFSLNKAVPLFVTEPLYDSICHNDTPFSK